MDNQPTSNPLQQDMNTMIFRSEAIREQISSSFDHTNDAVVPDEKSIMLFILGMVERINFDNVSHVVLGRFDNPSESEAQIDLSSFGAVERGVSRQHCQLGLQGDRLTVIDLGSSNGTFIAGKRLVPNQTYVLKKGEELMLGRLPVQIIVKG